MSQVFATPAIIRPFASVATRPSYKSAMILNAWMSSARPGSRVPGSPPLPRTSRDGASVALPGDSEGGSSPQATTRRKRARTPQNRPNLLISPRFYRQKDKLSGFERCEQEKLALFQYWGKLPQQWKKICDKLSF